MLVLALSAALWLLRWTCFPTHAGGDTFWYTKSALEFSGWKRTDAIAEAARFTVEVDPGGNTLLKQATCENCGLEEKWAEVANTIDPRYSGIFVERPIYPATAALLVSALGPSAMLASALAAGLFVGVLSGLFVLSRTSSLLSAVSATFLVFVLPSGAAIARLYADGWMLVWWTMALIATSVLLEDGRLRWMVALGVACVLIGLTKSANQTVLAVTLAGTALVVTLIPGGQPVRGAWVTAGVGAAITLLQLLIFDSLRLPGLVDSIQDLLTNHFEQPDVSGPFVQLLRRDRGLLIGWLLEAAKVPFDLIRVATTAGLLASVGVLSLLRTRAAWAIPWIIGGPATVLVVFVHPVSSEIPRLLAPLWVTVAVGIAILVPSMLQWVRGAIRVPTGPSEETTAS